MARRRSYGSVLRRRRNGKHPDGTPREGYWPGWYVRIRKGKRETIQYGGPDRATALEVLERMQREQARLELLGEFPSTRATFAEFAEEYLKHSEQRHTEATHATRRTMIQNILVPAFGTQRLAEIRRPHIEGFIATRTSCGPATRNRFLVVLSSMLQRAVDLRRIEANPVRGIRREREHVIPIPLVSLPDQDRLIRFLDEPYRPLFLLALETGMRIGEVVRLEWGDVDVKARTLQVRQTKAKRPRILYLSALLQDELRHLAEHRVRPLQGPDRVFPAAVGTDGKLRSSWILALKRAAARIGHPKLRVHDLRHLAAINLVRAGMDLPSVQQVLGHTNLLSTLRYAAYADQTAAQRAARLLDQVRAQREAERALP